MTGPDTIFKNRVGGEIGHAGEAWYGRDRRRRPRCNYEAAGGDGLAGGFNRIGRNEAGFGANDAAAQLKEALLAIVRCDGRNSRMHMIHNRGKADLRFHGRDAEGAAVAENMRVAGCGYQGLRGNAAEVQTIAAHPALLDENHLPAKTSSGSSDGQAARACANHADVAGDTTHRPAVPTFFRSAHRLTSGGTRAVRDNSAKAARSSGCRSEAAEISKLQAPAPFSATHWR